MARREGEDEEEHQQPAGQKSFRFAVRAQWKVSTKIQISKIEQDITMVLCPNSLGL